MYRVFTAPGCRYCDLAKSALDARGLDYEEVALTPEARAELREQGLMTVPQIYLHGHGHIGGFTDLVAHLDQIEREYEAEHGATPVYQEREK